MELLLLLLMIYTGAWSQSRMLIIGDATQTALLMCAANDCSGFILNMMGMD